MSNLKLLFCWIILFSFVPQVSRGQQFGDKNFYILDSIDLSLLHEDDKLLLDSSLTIYHNTLEDTIQLEMLENIVDNCWNGDIWPRYNDFAIKKVQKLLTQNRQEEERKKFAYFLAGGLSNRGFYYDQKGNLLEALNHYHESLLIYEKINNKQGTSTAFNNLGVIYSIIGDTAKALEYHNRSLKTKIELKDEKGVAMSYNNIGAIYENSSEPFKALEYYEKSLKISNSISDSRGIAMSLDNLGDIYLHENILGKAFDYYSRGLQKWTEIGFKPGISTAKNNLANVLIKMGEFDRAKTYAIESYQLAESLDFPVDIENSAKTLVTIYRHEGDFEKALFYSDSYIEMRDKIRNEQNANKAYKKSMQYEYQKEALKDSIEFSKEREIQQAELKQEKTQASAFKYGLILVFIILVIAVRSFLIKKKDNKKINEQKSQVENQKKEIELQHATLAKTHQEISDSINYAKRIQNAILPTTDVLNESLNNGFVLFMPKDVVSGDFYWLENLEDSTLVAVADCTGHGVPGAMVSVVCHNALNRAVREYHLSKPNEILDKTKELVVETFKSKSEFVRDGMDISLCRIHKNSEIVEWAGANNPLYIYKRISNSIEIISSNKQPVGVSDYSENFTNHELKLEQGDIIYLFTDGYMDQFGGEHGKKFKHSRFREIALDLGKQGIKGQKEVFEKEFHNWKGNLEQIDDICIIGIEL